MTVSHQQVEQVLVVPTLLFHEIGYFQGFSTDEGPEVFVKTTELLLRGEKSPEKLLEDRRRDSRQDRRGQPEGKAVIDHILGEQLVRCFHVALIVYPVNEPPDNTFVCLY